MKRKEKKIWLTPLEKYKFVTKPARTVNENGAERNVDPTIIAISTYADKIVKGYSRCHPNDFGHYDADYGNQLAAALDNKEDIVIYKLLAVTKKE